MPFILLLALLTTSPDDLPRSRARALAMLIELRGKVEIRPAEGMPRPAETGDMLYPGERLTVPDGGAAVVAILGSGVRESIRPGSEVSVGASGCSPTGAIASSKASPKSVASALKGLKPAPGDGRKAGYGFRSGEAEPAITPIQASTVSSDRPAFAWPPAPGATRYRVELRIDGAEELLWTVGATSPSLPYPEGRAALRRDVPYSWTVIDDGLRKVASGKFSVASASDLTGFAEAAALRASAERADRLLGVISYQHLHAYQEAIEAASDLARNWPAEPAYRQALAELLRVAGRGEAP